VFGHRHTPGLAKVGKNIIGCRVSNLPFSAMNEASNQSNQELMQVAITEVRAFVKNQTEKEAKAELKAKAEAWTKYAALSMAVIALIAGYAMSKGGSCSGRVAKDLSEATYNQTNASDQWSFYQSKAQKQLLAELEINLKTATKSDEEGIKALKAKVTRYDKEKAEIQAGAKKFEEARDGFRQDAERMTALGGKFGQAAQAFQIALAIGGLCLLSKKRWMWYITLGAAAFGVYLLALALMAAT